VPNDEADETGERSKFGDRARKFWWAHRTLFWTLHSVWALATGVLIILFARDRYGFVPWVVLFLVLTWISTLFFSRKLGPDQEARGGPGFMEEATSYVTRTMYQETLFFLLPFYAYSTVVVSPNVVFTALLAGLAVVSCFDLQFDHWLHVSRVARLFFFALVSFAAINLLLPILLPMDPTTGLHWAAGIAIVSAIPLALRGERPSGKELATVVSFSLIFASIAVGFPRLIPAVPLRVEHAVFTSDFEPLTLVAADTLAQGTSAAALPDGLYVLLHVFAPTIVPTEVTLEWRRDGELLRASRSIEITAHELGFRLWEAWKPESGSVAPGRYQVVLKSRSQRIFGDESITIAP
jgi:hypothetical protein